METDTKTSYNVHSWIRGIIFMCSHTWKSGANVEDKNVISEWLQDCFVSHICVCRYKNKLIPLIVNIFKIQFIRLYCKTTWLVQTVNCLNVCCVLRVLLLNTVYSWNNTSTPFIIAYIFFVGFCSIPLFRPIKICDIVDVVTIFKPPLKIGHKRNCYQLLQ